MGVFWDFVVDGLRRVCVLIFVWVQTIMIWDVYDGLGLT